MWPHLAHAAMCLPALLPFPRRIGSDRISLPTCQALGTFFFFNVLFLERAVAQEGITQPAAGTESSGVIHGAKGNALGHEDDAAPAPACCTALSPILEGGEHKPSPDPSLAGCPSTLCPTGQELCAVQPLFSAFLQSVFPLCNLGEKYSKFKRQKPSENSSNCPPAREVGGDAMTGDVEEGDWHLLWQPMEDEK